jgi:site-specific DNA recombinase
VIVRECPAIVDETLWKRAAQQVSQNKTSPVHSRGRNYLLLGLIECGVCGTPFRGNGDGKGYFRYTCGDALGNSLVPKLPRSQAPSLPAKEVEEYVWEQIRAFVQDPDAVIERLENQREETHVGDLEERKQHLLKRLQEKRQEKDRYVILYAKGSLSEEEADTHIRAAMMEINHLSMLHGAVESDIAETRMEEKQNQETVNWLSTLAEKLEEVEADTKEAFATRRFLTELLLDFHEREPRRNGGRYLGISRLRSDLELQSAGEG